MKIGLIDVDGHNFPNLALMKISAYHKAKGDNDIFDAEEIGNCIIMDYPYKALKIVDVFIRHIKPKIKEYEEDKQCRQLIY